MGRSDELDGSSYGTDKFEAGYLRHYDREFAHLVEHPIVLLEIGVLRGASLALWADYFPQGRVVGVDLNPLGADDILPDRTAFARGNQADVVFLDEVAEAHAPDGFDLIVDDASHLGRESLVTFRHAFEHHLKAGGTYVLEDWQTGYWPAWFDGLAVRRRLPAAFDRLRTSAPRVRGGGRLARRSPFPSHQAGMVGVIKQVVDFLGDPEHSHIQMPTARIDRIALTAGLAFIVKAGGSDS
jgi:hypothetical protein